MKKIMSAAAVAFCAMAVPASAVTINLSNSVFDSVNRSWFFSDVTTTTGGADVNLTVTTDAPLNSRFDFRNEEGSARYFQSNFRILSGGNLSTFTFSFTDDLDNAVTLTDVEIGVFDIDFTGREVITAINAVSYTTTVDTELDITTSGSDVTATAMTTNVVNPSDFSALTPDQQDVSIVFNFGDVSTFQIEAGILPGTSGSGRNFQYGEVTFTEATVTTPTVAPIPLPPALAMMLWGLGGIFFVGMRRKNRTA